MGFKPRKLSVIADREYWLATIDRRRQTVLVSIEAPVPDRGGSYSCTFRIEGLEDSRAIERRMCGADAVQALYIAMQAAWVALACSRAYTDGRLTLDGSQNLGLPIVDTIRERAKLTSWARVHLGPPNATVPDALENTMRTHLTTYPDDELLRELQALAESGHANLPFCSDEAATSFRDEVRSLGIECDLWLPPTPALL